MHLCAVRSHSRQPNSAETEAESKNAIAFQRSNLQTKILSLVEILFKKGSSEKKNLLLILDHAIKSIETYLDDNKKKRHFPKRCKKLPGIGQG